MFNGLLAQAFCLLSLAIIVSSAPAVYSQGLIVSPANGSTIAPGAVFPFKYNAHADYCISSYNFSVWLLTDKPSHFSPSASFASGHYFGTYEEPNYPGEPAYF